MITEVLEPRFVEYVPARLEPGVLYVSMEYATAAHLCPCGCGSRVVTPLGPPDWRLLFDGSVSLRPSIGNGQIPCRSHYFIQADRVLWAPPMTKDQTRRAQYRDRAALAAHARGGQLSKAVDPWIGEGMRGTTQGDRHSVWQRATSFLRARLLRNLPRNSGGGPR